MMIDAHQHFWKYTPERHGWIGENMSNIRRDFLPDELQQMYREHGIDGCVGVQVNQDEDDNEFFLELSRKHAFIKGLVAWVDFTKGDIQERLSYYSEQKVVKGFRHLIQEEKAPEFCLREDFCRGISLLKQFDFSYDILVKHYQLGAVLKFVAKFPNQRFIIDHIAKPDIASHNISGWEKNMRAIAKHQNVLCKLSGMVTEADFKNWKYDDIIPYIDVVLESFGTSRLVYGSDWPVCLAAASYEKQLDVVKKAIEKLSANEKKQILGENAVRFYKL